MFDYDDDDDYGYEDGYDGDIEETDYLYEDFDEEVTYPQYTRLIASKDEPTSFYCPDDGKFYLPFVYSYFELIHGGKTVEIKIDFETYDKLTIHPTIW